MPSLGGLWLIRREMINTVQTCPFVARSACNHHQFKHSEMQTCDKNLSIIQFLDALNYNLIYQFLACRKLSQSWGMSTLNISVVKIECKHLFILNENPKLCVVDLETRSNVAVMFAQFTRLPVRQVTSPSFPVVLLTLMFF